MKYQQLFLLLVAALVFSSCTPKEPKLHRPKKGALFSFSYQAVKELSIAKNDPATGDAWNAELAAKSGIDGQDVWEIKSAPGKLDLVDRLADSGFIRHLLDTLGTITIAGTAPKGPLSSYGLTPPVFAIRWRDSDKQHELRLGSQTGTNEARFGFAPPNEEVYIVQGAALKMLAYLSSFEGIRQRRLVTFDSDDVDEFEIFSGTKRLMYVERETDYWINEKGKPLRGSQELLDQLTHIRIKNFIDKAELNKKLLSKLEKPMYRAVFKDRGGNPTVLKVVVADSSVYASLSSRSGSVFELFSEAIRSFSIRKT